MQTKDSFSNTIPQAEDDALVVGRQREVLSEFARIKRSISDIGQLTKFRLSATVVLSSVLAYGVAASSWIWVDVLAIFLGGMALTMAANVLNQVLEREFDGLMSRTSDRPLPKQRMSVSRAVLWAGMLSVFGILALSAINPLAVLLGMVALLSYAFVYTPLKRFSVAAVFVGTIPGAIPAMIGTVAAEGVLTELGWALFAIQVLWQIPHFWAIGWLGFDDYKKAGFRLLPETESGERDPGTGIQAMVYALILAGLVWWPYFLGFYGIIAAVLSCIFSLVYAWYGWKLYSERSRKSALGLMFFSFFYLPAVFGLGCML